MRESLTPSENGKSFTDDGRGLSPSPKMGNDDSKTANIQKFFSSIIVVVIVVEIVLLVY